MHQRSRRLAIALLTLVTLLAPVSASAEPSTTPRADFFSIGAVVGAPYEPVSGDFTDGSVTVFQTQSPSPTLDPTGSIVITEADVGGTPVYGNSYGFGAAVALGDLNGDSLADLAIGSPNADQRAGRVYVVFRSPSDGQLDVDHAVVIRQGAAGITGTSEPDDNFGASLLIGHESGGDPWLAIGAPGEGVGIHREVGAVTIIPGGTDSTGDISFYQGKGIPGTAEITDHFGASLASYGLGGLAVGAPDEDDGTITDAGQVTGLGAAIGGLPGSGSSISFKQGSNGVPGTSEARDHFGAAIVGRLQNALSIGIPGEDVGPIEDAGDVVDIPVPGQCCTTATNWYQGHNGLVGTAEEGDKFGSVLTATATGNLVVGVPLEDIGTHPGAGVIHVIRQAGGGSTTLTATGNRSFHQDTSGVPGMMETSDHFGGALGRGVNTLFVGVPGEDVGAHDRAGALVVLRIAGGLVDTTQAGQQITQDTNGVVGSAGYHDGFGGSVSGRQSSLET